MANDFRKASDVLNALFSGFDSDGLRQSNSFIRGWKETVGDKVSAHSKVVDVDRGILTVEVDHPGWNQQIQYMKKRILSSLSRSFPELGIVSIAVRVKSETAAPYQRQNGKVGEGLTRSAEETGETAEESDAPVNESLNPELQDLFARLKASIKRGKPD